MPTRAGILAVLLFPLAAAAADKSLGMFRDWSAMRYGSGKDLACMAFSQPTKSEGKYKKRGDAFVFVTRRREGKGVSMRVSVETGYTYKKGSTVALTVGKASFTLETGGSTAWLDSAEAGRKLVAAMRGGRELVVKGTSSRGTKTTDRYSLYGFTAAHKAIAKSCPRR